MHDRVTQIRIALARLILRGTGQLVVPLKEVEEVDALCKELQEYSVASGALSDPRRVKASKRIWSLTSRLFIKTGMLKEEVDSV